MAFIRKDFMLIGGLARRGDAPRVFSYKTTDAGTAVAASGYFNEMAEQLDAGDIILVSTMASGAATACDLLAVAAITAGVVTTVGKVDKTA